MRSQVALGGCCSSVGTTGDWDTEPFGLVTGGWYSGRSRVTSGYSAFAAGAGRSSSAPQPVRASAQTASAARRAICGSYRSRRADA